MIVSNTAVDRRTTVFVSLLLIAISGLYSYTVLPRESTPEVVIPILLVTTTYQGVAPADMESLVTIPIERKLTGIAGVKTIQSTSSEGVSVIQVEFEADEDVDEVRQKVRDKVDQAKPDLPEEADDPQIAEINVSDFPFMFISMTGERVPLSILTKLSEDLEDDIEAVKGVLEVNVVGGVEREIQIVVDPDRITEYGVSLADLVTLARVENVNTPAGAMTLDEGRFSVRVPGEFTSADELNSLVVKAGPAGVVYLRDIAQIRDAYKDVESVSRLNGKEAVTLAISKRAGENLLRVADDVRGAMESFRPRLLPGMDMRITMDHSNDIRDMVAELENNIISGLILVLVVVLVFMGLANAVMVSLAIPLSMLITFVMLYVTGTTLNMVVLFSLILALGMLVDNGIVVVENIYRMLQGGLSPVQAAKAGAGEVAWPIISSTLTTVAAFSPLFFWPGIWGSFMFYLPQTVCTALVGSLFVGLVVNPALSSRLGKTKKGVAPISLDEPEPMPRAWIIRLYAAVLRLALRWRLVTVFTAFTCLVVPAAMFLHNPRIEFTPETEPRRGYIDVDASEGTRLEMTDGVVRAAEAAAAEHMDDLEYLLANTGSRGASTSVNETGTSSHIGRVTMDFFKLGEREKKPSEIIDAVRRQIRAVTGAKLTLQKEQEGPPEDPPVNVEITGDEFAVLAEIAQKVTDTIADIPGLVDLRDDFEPGKPEIRVEVDREQALLMGLNTEFVGKAVQAAINGRKAGTYREGDKEYDVTVRFPENFRDNMDRLGSVSIVNMGGRPVPLASVAKIVQGVGLGPVKRIDRNRCITVSADAAAGISGAELLIKVKERLKGFPLPSGYRISYTGQNEDQQESQTFLMEAFVVALLLIALILITQFNSIIQTFIIMTSVILSLSGVFLGLVITKTPFNIIMTGIGVISLAGVVVNNAIVLLDFINVRRRQGLETDAAIVEAGMTRFRPVMLTAVTTVLGLVPMAVGVSYDFFAMEWIVGGESAQWWGPMAIAVIFGLSFATLLTLIVVPVLYSITTSVHLFFYPGDKPGKESA